MRFFKIELKEAAADSLKTRGQTSYVWSVAGKIDAADIFLKEKPSFLHNLPIEYRFSIAIFLGRFATVKKGVL